MYEEILFPTDGSSGSRAAMEHALDIASTYGARVHVLHVVDAENQASHLVARDDDTDFSGMVKPDEVETKSGVTATGSGLMERLEDAGERLVERLSEEIDGRGVEHVAEVRRGTPFRAIVDYADDNGIDLIVMSTHGRSGVDRYLVGSVTERVVRTADVPVLTVRDRGEATEEND